MVYYEGQGAEVDRGTGREEGIDPDASWSFRISTRDRFRHLLGFGLRRRLDRARWRKSVRGFVGRVPIPSSQQHIAASPALSGSRSKTSPKVAKANPERVRNPRASSLRTERQKQLDPLMLYADRRSSRRTAQTQPSVWPARHPCRSSG